MRRKKTNIRCFGDDFIILDEFQTLPPIDIVEKLSKYLLNFGKRKLNRKKMLAMHRPSYIISKENGLISADMSASRFVRSPRV